MVWEPEHAVPDDPLPTVLLLDGEDLVHGVDVARVFGSIVEQGIVPLFRAMLLHNPSVRSRMTEYPCNSLFPDFLVNELLPALRSDSAMPNLPPFLLIGGFSYGGLAATWVGFNRPDVFSGVIASSPSLWWSPGVRVPVAGQVSHVAVQSEWLTQQFTRVPRVPLRFSLDVGLLEDQDLPFVGNVSQLACVRRFRDVLCDRGYEVLSYEELPCGHEYLGWRAGLVHGLSALLS